MSFNMVLISEREWTILWEGFISSLRSTEIQISPIMLEEMKEIM